MRLKPGYVSLVWEVFNSVLVLTRHTHGRSRQANARRLVCDLSLQHHLLLCSRTVQAYENKNQSQPCR